MMQCILQKVYPSRTLKLFFGEFTNNVMLIFKDYVERTFPLIFWISISNIALAHCTRQNESSDVCHYGRRLTD